MTGIFVSLAPAFGLIVLAVVGAVEDAGGGCPFCEGGNGPVCDDCAGDGW